MNNKKILVSTIIALLLTFSFIFPGFVSAHPSSPGETPNVWSDRLLPEVCSLVYMPVHDAKSTVYSNACTAALDGIKVTWDGEHLR